MNNIQYFFPFVFIGVWVFVTYMISRMGWADLVANYQYDYRFIGKRVGVITASINSINYKNSLILKYNDDGIYLAPVFLFRLFHKPILIPWKEIKEVRDKKVLFFSYKELIVGSPFVAVIGLDKRVFGNIESRITF